MFLLLSSSFTFVTHYSASLFNIFVLQVSLNKFLRLAGDLLPPPLFVPYMEMLTGLANSPQAAHHCFNLLKSAANGPVSWDHFFGSIKQYYLDLRQDSGNTGDIFIGLFICTHTCQPS